MKGGELVDVGIQEQNSQVVIELQNGQRIATNRYYHDISKRGEPIIVIQAGRKLK